MPQSELEKEIQNWDAHQLMQLFLKNKENSEIVNAIKNGVKDAKLHLYLTSEHSEVSIKFANPKNDFTWNFLDTNAPKVGDHEKLVVYDKKYSPVEVSGTEGFFKCNKKKTAKAVFALVKLIKSVFVTHMDSIVMNTEILAPFTVSRTVLESIARQRVEHFHIRGKDHSYGGLGYVLSKISVTKNLTMDHMVANEQHDLDLENLTHVEQSIIMMNKRPFECLRAAGRQTTVTIEWADASELNSMLMDWTCGINTRTEFFSLKINHFKWKTIDKLLTNFSRLTPDGLHDPYENISLVERLLQLSLEGVNIVRPDRARATIFFSPNTPKSKDGHTLTMIAEYNWRGPLTNRLDQILADRSNDKKQLNWLEGDLRFALDVETQVNSWLYAHIAGIPIKRSKRELNSRHSRLVLKSCTADQVRLQVEMDVLKKRIETATFLYYASFDDEKRTASGSFHIC